jgi:site-specific DNA recombinase
MSVSANLRVALYARVSPGRQTQESSIASQLVALHQRATADGCAVPEELRFVDDGYTGATLLRPALERLRDQVANGVLDRLYVHSPDRLARNFAHQAVLIEEFRRGGVEVVFLNRNVGQSPEDDLLLQVQGVIAEYERARIRENCRRGRLHAARSGRISVLGSAPYGYRYVCKHDGGGVARYDIDPEAARVVRQIFAWVASEWLSLSEVCRRLQRQGVPTPSGQGIWRVGSVRMILANPAYQGTAAYGKTRSLPRLPRLRPQRGHPEVPRRPCSVTRQGTEPITICVPALVSTEEFAQVAEQLQENRRRLRVRRAGARYLLQGLVVCQSCGYAFIGISRRRHQCKTGSVYSYYRCSGRYNRTNSADKDCKTRNVRCADLEEVVWQDVCLLLRHPEKVEEEYRRRLEGEPGDTAGQQVEPLTRLIGQARRALGRLIDSYSEGLIDKSEFEPRVKAARQRLGRLETQVQDQVAAEARRAELRLALNCLEEFATEVRSGLEQADWAKRREIIRALVKRIEVSQDEVRIVYRVAPVPFVEAPIGGICQDRQTYCNVVQCMQRATTSNWRDGDESQGLLGQWGRALVRLRLHAAEPEAAVEKPTGNVGAVLDLGGWSCSMPSGRRPTWTQGRMSVPWCADRRW